MERRVVCFAHLLEKIPFLSMLQTELCNAFGTFCLPSLLTRLKRASSLNFLNKSGEEESSQVRTAGEAVLLSHCFGLQEGKAVRLLGA